MKGDKKVIEYLNKGLKAELTAINQYFLHARMLKDMGLYRLADHEYGESIEEMRHADSFIERILFLDGLPNLQDLGKLMIGENAKEMLECDLQLEHDAHALYREAVGYCESAGDYVSRDMFSSVLSDEEDHIDYIETQLEQIDRMGIENYIQAQTGNPNPDEDE